MLAPNLQQTDFQQALANLAPSGRAWPRDPSSIFMQMLFAMAGTFFRHNGRANNLLVDGFPATTVELLPEWEASLGLPDPCAGESPTIQQRRAQVVARFASTGGQSRPYFISYALALGYSITAIINYAPFRAGISRAGDPCCGNSWAYTWGIVAPLNQVQYFRAGQSAAGEPLAVWSNNVLECELNAIKPAHTYLLFQYQ